MCVPLAALAVGAMIGGTAIGAVGSIMQGEQAAKAGSFNAEMKRREATEIQNIAADKGAQKTQEGKRLAATQHAMSSAGGVTTDGTTGDILKETSMFSELDALRITSNASRQAWGLRSQANIEQWQGKQARTAGYISAGASLLSSAGSGYFGGVQAGLFPKVG